MLPQSMHFRLSHHVLCMVYRDGMSGKLIARLHHPWFIVTSTPHSRDNKGALLKQWAWYHPGTLSRNWLKLINEHFQKLLKSFHLASFHLKVLFHHHQLVLLMIWQSKQYIGKLNQPVPKYDQNSHHLLLKKNCKWKMNHHKMLCEAILSPKW